MKSEPTYYLLPTDTDSAPWFRVHNLKKILTLKDYIIISFIDLL